MSEKLEIPIEDVTADYVRQEAPPMGEGALAEIPEDDFQALRWLLGQGLIVEARVGGGINPETYSATLAAALIQAGFRRGE